MHCIPLYPTQAKDLQLNQIETLCKRYPSITIGFSTHESPGNYDAVKVAYSKGARIFERHIGLRTNKISLNDYSSQPYEVKGWVESWREAVSMCGAVNRPPASEEMVASLQSLKRGVYLARDVKKDSRLKRGDVFFAMPLLDGALDSGSWFEGMVSDADYLRYSPLPASLVLQKHGTTRAEIIKDVILQVKGLLNDASISIDKDSQIELSHHYGIERFREYGAIIVNTINREYCKKLVIQLPSQNHPYHYHRKKAETFQVLFGDMELEKDGYVHYLNPGDMIHIEPKQYHKFKTSRGVVVEEVSTTHYNNDSYYEDERICLMPREERKTLLKNVGGNRFLYEENLFEK